MKIDNNKLIPVFLCGTDAAYHIPGDAHGVRVYFSEKSLRKDSPCVNAGCGIIRVKLDMSKPHVIQAEDWDKMVASSISMEELAKKDLVNAYKNIIVSFKKAYLATKRYFKWTSKKTKLKLAIDVPKHINK